MEDIVFHSFHPDPPSKVNAMATVVQYTIKKPSCNECRMAYIVIRTFRDYFSKAPSLIHCLMFSSSSAVSFAKCEPALCT